MIFTGGGGNDDTFGFLIRMAGAEALSEANGERKRELLAAELRIALIDLCYRLLAKKTGIDPGVYN